MALREIVGYGLLAVLLLVAATAFSLWRRKVIRDRMMRWGTPHSPRRIRRRGYE